MKSESVKILGLCPHCQAQGRLTHTGTAQKAVLRGGRPFCFHCGYLDSAN